MSAQARLLLSGQWGIALLVLGWCGVTWGQVITDPTRPAPAWLAAQPKAPGMPAAETNTIPTLQLLMLGKSRKYAIIGGQMVKLGDNYNGSKLVAIRPDAVVLQSDGALQTLKIQPAIQKTVITQKPSGETGELVSRRKTVVIGESK